MHGLTLLPAKTSTGHCHYMGCPQLPSGCICSVHHTWHFPWIRSLGHRLRPLPDQRPPCCCCRLCVLLDEGPRAIPNAQVRRRAPCLVPHVDAAAQLQQQVHDRQLVVLRRQVQRRGVVVGEAVQAGAAVDQQAGGAHRAVAGGAVQGGPALPVGGVHLAAAVQQQRAGLEREGLVGMDAWLRHVLAQVVGVGR